MPNERITKEALVEYTTPRNNWFYPSDFENDLAGIVGLRGDQICEALNTAWEYVRVVIPAYTNYDRYVAFARLIQICIIAEVRGSLVNVVSGDNILGFQIDELLDAVFTGFPGHIRKDMAREFRTFLLFTAEKVSDRRSSDFFRRYVNALAHSPKDWFRMRDCDGLARFTIAGAMACNEVEDVWFTEDEWQILCEIGSSLYDVVAFQKHRAEGEIHSTFAYFGVDQQLRMEAFEQCRETLWRLDVAWARIPKNQCVLNFIRNVGGPLHITMRRYRFVDDGLMIGKPVTEDVVNQTRQNFKLWNRVDVKHVSEGKGEEERFTNQSYYARIAAQKSKLLFDGLAEKLEADDTGHCRRCRYRLSYGAETPGQFGGVELCDACKEVWQAYLRDLPARAENAFPVLLTVKPRHPPTSRTATRTWADMHSQNLSLETEESHEPKRKRTDTKN